MEIDELQALVRQELGRDRVAVVLSPAAQAVVVRAVEEASRLDEGTIGSEHLLLALAGESDGGVPAALGALGMTQPTIRRQIAVLLAQAAERDAPPDAPAGEDAPA